MLTNPMKNIIVYIKAYITERYQLELRQVNNIISPLEKFNDKVNKLEEKKVYLDNMQVVDIFFIILQDYQENNIERYVTNETKSVFERFKNKNCTRYDLENGCNLICFYDSEDNHIIDYIINFWLKIESPMIYGKQILLNSYMLRDFYNRRIIGAYPDYSNSNWNLLLEGELNYP